MPKRSRTDLGALIQKYQGRSVVEEIEKNLSSLPRYLYPEKSLYLYGLYDEKNYDLDLYKGLEESIVKDGFLAPLILIKEENGFAVINGAKRYLIGKKLGLKTMPGVLADLSKERLTAYVLETIAEESDCPLVKTTCFKRLVDDGTLSVSEISGLTSLSESQVRNLIRLDGLPEFLKDALRQKKITYTKARALLRLSPEDQQAMYREILAGHCSVRKIESAKRKSSGKAKKRKVTLHKKSVTITFASEEEAKEAYPTIVESFSD